MNRWVLGIALWLGWACIALLMAATTSLATGISIWLLAGAVFLLPPAVLAAIIGWSL